MSYRSTFQPLEPRLHLAFNPSPREQAALELINRMRQFPANEINLLLNHPDADVKAALDFFNVNITTLKQQWSKLVAVPPVAWNEDLYDAAVAHSREMIEADAQEHQLPGEPDLGDRVTAQGYNFSALGENIFAYATSVFQGHAGFAIDWGSGPGGIQSPAGHRITIMNGDYREVGVAILDSPKTSGRETGPLVTTQDFGNRSNFGNPFLLGTVRRERKNGSVYDAGEGLGKVSVTISNSTNTFTTTTLGAGAYQLKVPAGTYTITAKGLAVGGTVTRKNVVVGASNVKADFVLPPDTVNPTATINSAPKVTATGTAYDFKITYADNIAINAKSISTGDLQITGPSGFTAIPTLVSRSPNKSAKTITATYRLTPPGGSWNRPDNGTYSIRVLRNQVKDLNNRSAAATTLGTFAVSIPASARRRSDVALVKPTAFPFSLKPIESALFGEIDRVVTA